MNKKAFITSALLYGILSLFLLLILGTVTVLSNRKLANDKIKESALDDAQNLTTDPSCFTFTTNDRGNLTITAYDSSCDKTVFIPETYNGVVVDAIGAYAFSNMDLINVTIKSNIVEIYTNAFNGNDEMIFYIKTTSDQIAEAGTVDEITNNINTGWGAKDATVHWDY